MKKSTNAKPFLDTNVLVYAFSTGDPRCEAARSLLAAGGVLGVQVLNEFVSVVRRKLNFTWDEVRQALNATLILCPYPAPLSLEAHRMALDIAEHYGFHIFDSLVIATAVENGCTLFYSEDMRDGQTVQGVLIRNPFAAQGGQLEGREPGPEVY